MSTKFKFALVVAILLGTLVAGATQERVDGQPSISSGESTGTGSTTVYRGHVLPLQY